MSRRLASLFLFPCLLIAATAPAQTVDFDVLVDTDRSAATGCSVTPSGSAALSGFERRIRASVDLGSFEIIALEQSACAGAGFGAPAPVSGFATPYPLALNTGIGGADAVELAVGRAALGAANLNQLRLTFVADSGSGSDVLATTNGGAGGGPIVFGLPVQIPALSVWGLGALVLVLLALAWLAHRRLGRVGAVMAVMLVTTAAWAMTFALDGDLTDWGGRAPNATDPAGDATDGSAAIDLVAGFVVLDGDDLFFRMDVSDTENQAPVAVDDAFSTDEDTSLNIAAPGVLSNDSDAELDPITAVLDAGPANAVSFNLNADGSFDYVPNADFNGSDSFTYFANDGQSDSAAATVTITVNAINDAPVAVDDVATTNEDTQVDIDVLANDSDVDGGLDPATVSVTSGPANGAASVNTTTGVITYTKSGDFNGTDSFVYEVCDDGTPLPALCTTATVSINVDPVNDAPTADAGAASTDEDTPVTVTLTGSDVEGDPLIFAIASAPASGSLGTINQVDATTAEVVYTPNADFNGADSFTFTVNDGTDTSPAQTFTITVNPVDDPPVAVDDSATVTEDDPATAIDVLLNDTDIDGGPISIASASQPAGGTVVITGGGTGLTYQPDPNFCNDGSPTDDFSYTLTPGGSIATVAVTVTCQNDAPVIAFPSGGTSFDNTGPVLLDPAATLNDVDSPDFDTGDLTASLALSADSSMCDVLDTLTIENQGMGAGQIGFDGTDVSFEGTTFGTVTTPYLCTDSGGGVFDIQPLLITFDPDASQAAVTALLRALQYNTTSTDDQDREASVMVTDGDGGTSNAAVTTITVTLNAPPTANDDTFSIDENSADGAAVGTVSATDPDAGQTLSYAITAGNTNTTFAIDSTTGAITLNNPPGVDFETPPTTFNLTVTVIDDGTPVLNDTAAITVNVNDVNEAPTANDDTFSIDENSAGGTSVGTVSATDPDAGQTLSYAITAGNTNTTFAIDSSTGAINLNNPPGVDFETTPTTFNLTVTVTDDGAPVLNDTAAITVNVNDVNEAPSAVNESFAAQSNVGIAPNAMNGLLANDNDPDSGDSLSLAAASVGTFSTTAGGSITTLADGSFTYTPQAGDAGVTDTFAYTVQDTGGLTDSATVTFNVDSNTIWFVDLDAGTMGDGTLNNPFDSLADLDNGGPDADSSTIFHYTSTMGTQTDALNDDFDLQANQFLIGEGATGIGTINDLRMFTTHPHSPTLPSIGGPANHAITSSANGGITLATGNTIRGIDIGNTGLGTGITGNNFGILTVADVSIFGTGQAVDLSTGTASVTFDSISSANSGAEGLVLDSVSGSFTVSGSTLIENPFGFGVSLQNSPAAFSFGNVTVNARNSAGVFINGFTGGVQNGQFGTVTINNQNASATTAFGIDNIVTPGSTITVAGVVIDNNGANSSAIALSNNDGATININGGSIQNAAGAAVSISSSTGNATYAGTIANTSGRSVQVLNNGVGVTTLSGNITDSGSGIFVDNNDQGGIAATNFSGVLDLNTATNTAFSATNGGIVSAINTGSTITTTTGTAVLIADTTIGVSGVTLRSVTTAGASANTAIALSNTGAGSFEVTGTGTVGSGGTIDNKTADAITLDNTGGSVTLRGMIIEDIGSTGVIDSEHDAIHGQTVNGGLVLDGMTIRRISDMAIHGAAFPSGDSDTVWNGLTITNSTIQDTNRYHVAGAGDTSDEGSVRIRGLRGNALISGNTFQNGAEHLDLFATAGTLNLTVTGNDFFESYKEFTSGGTASVGKMCVDLTVQGTADATVVIGDLVDAALGNNFRNCRIASVRIGNDSGATGTVTTTTANNSFLVTDHSSGIGGDFDFPMGGVKYSTRGATTAVFDGRISNNTFTDVTNADGGVGNVTLDMDQGVIQVLVDGNTFHAPGNAAWFVRADGTSSFDLLFDNNIYQRDAFPCTTDPSCGGGFFGPGLFNRTQAQNGAVLDVTYRDEAFAQHDTGFDPGNTVEVQALNVGGGGTVCASFTGNSAPHGYALEESAGDLNLFDGLSAVTGTCPTANCVTVLDDNMNTGGGGNPAADPPTVSVFGTVDIVSPACSLPSGTIF